MPVRRLVILTLGLAAAGCGGGTPANTAPDPGAPAPTVEGPAAPEQAPTPVTTPSGLQYIELSLGNGPLAVPGTRVSVHYTGWLLDGTKFDSSLDRNMPFEFRLGAGEVIPGWDEGIANMHVGDRRQLIIPAALAYGRHGSPPNIPPDATLIFDVYLLGVR